ncbi:hypothetical protein B0H12DRAFT_202491 [Mycena haematopus]|nr:hypothetical protein B0H12DRAFT_202491 [Mycena haematopus]
MTPNEKEALMKSITNTLDLGNFQLLELTEELGHKVKIAHDIVNTRQAVARVTQARLAETAAQVEIRKVERKIAKIRVKEAVEIRKAERKLAKIREKELAYRDETRKAEHRLAAFREKEAVHRVEYFHRLSDVADRDACDAELEAALFRVRGRKVGVEQGEPGHRLEDIDPSEGEDAAAATEDEDAVEETAAAEKIDVDMEENRADICVVLD